MNGTIRRTQRTPPEVGVLDRSAQPLQKHRNDWAANKCTEHSDFGCYIELHHNRSTFPEGH